MVRLLCLFGLSFLGAINAQAQHYWAAIHSVTGTTATAVSVVQKNNTANGDTFYTRPTSLIVCATQAGTFTLERGGTAPTGTLSTTYPSYTMIPTSVVFPAYSSWPFSFYTASDSTGGVVISKIVLTGAGCAPFSGLSPNKAGNPVQMQRDTTQLYTVRAALGASGDVHFSLNGEAYK